MIKFSFKTRVIIITGASSSGIGKELALQLARKGASNREGKDAIRAFSKILCYSNAIKNSFIFAAPI